MEEKEILEKRKAGKFVIKVTDRSSHKVVGNPFKTPFPDLAVNRTYAVLDSFEKTDLPQLKKFAAERLGCKVENTEIEIFEPLEVFEP